MATLPNPLAPARAAGRLLSGVVSMATAPARGALGLLEALLEEISERVLPPEPPPGTTGPAESPFFGPGVDATEGPAPVTPSVARVPAAKRRRTRMRDPGPPVVLPDLPDSSGEELREDAPSSATARAAVIEELREDAPPAPAHVEAGETLVAEIADPGAEDGAGAELHVEEPWPRYDALSASDVVDRLVAQDEAALSVLLLYERTHRARKTVLDAAERELARRG